MATLNKDQQKIYDQAMQGQSLFLTGAAGTGKSFLLKQIIKGLRSAKRNVVVTASTGTAAVRINGMTIHRAFGLSSKICCTDDGMPIVHTPKLIQKADVIVIDEISMVRRDLFDAVVASVENAERMQNKKISLIVCGDFYQLPPVVPEKDKKILDKIYGGIGSGYAFCSPEWERRNLQKAELNTVIRQDEQDFIDLLNGLRIGDVSVIRTLNKNIGTMDPNAINLLPTNEAVDAYNEMRLSSIPSCPVKFSTIQSGKIDHPDYQAVCPADLIVKEGARVIMTKNDSCGADCMIYDPMLNIHMHHQSGPVYHNGSSGTVTQVVKDGIYIALDNGYHIYQMRYHCEVIHQVLDDKTGKIKDEHLGFYEQIPVRVAYAMTVHRSQGATFEAINLDPSSFAHGQLYTAISRVRSLEGLHLLRKITDKDLIVDVAVHSFYAGEFVAQEKILLDLKKTEHFKKTTEYFAVFEHKLIYDGDKLLTRHFIILRDPEGNILGWTDLHKYVFGRKFSRIISVTSTNEKRCRSVVSFLNYIFFDKYHISKLTDLTVDMVRGYLNDFGLCRLPGDTDLTHRCKSTVENQVSYLMDFLDRMIKDYPKCKMRTDDLYSTEKVFDKRKRRYVGKKVPTFEVNYKPKTTHIFRDIPESVFQIIMTEIAINHKHILMLAALSAFAGLRPSESCNVRREDSVLGPGLMFDKVDGEIVSVNIDITEEKCLRSDLVSVGKIKKERKQKVYPAFLEVFADCYNSYMDYIQDQPYEAEYGALTNTSFGKAYTYDAYYKEFKKVINAVIPQMLASDDPQVVIYGHLLQEHTISPHIFRHWFSVKLTLYGEDVAGLMYWRGDKSPESALTYLANKSDLEKQYEKVSDAVFDYTAWKASKVMKKDG